MSAAGPWRPMEEAPRDGTLVLLAILDDEGTYAYRVAYWARWCPRGIEGIRPRNEIQGWALAAPRWVHTEPEWVEHSGEEAVAWAEIKDPSISLDKDDRGPSKVI